jgi:hypothetical protein
MLKHPYPLLLASLAMACARDDVEPTVRVRWIEVAASDYKLDLVPAFDADVTDYSALADGPGIEVYVDVTLSADVPGITVNGVAAAPNGYRVWRSDPGTALVAPTTANVEILDPRAAPDRYTIDITVP